MSVDLDVLRGSEPHVSKSYHTRVDHLRRIARHSGTRHGFLAIDADHAGNRPGVLVVHGGAGVDDHARGRARRFAEAGFVAFACDMYGESVTGNRQRIMRHIGDLRNNRTALVRRVQPAIEILSSRRAAVLCTKGGERPWLSRRRSEERTPRVMVALHTGSAHGPDVAQRTSGIGFLQQQLSLPRAARFLQVSNVTYRSPPTIGRVTSALLKTRTPPCPRAPRARARRTVCCASQHGQDGGRARRS